MRRSYVLVLAAMLALAFYNFPLAHASAPTRIIAVDYPTIVRTDGLFTVRIQVAYSARFGMMDVGIWDLGTGSVIQSFVTNATLSGPGYGDYSFHLKASDYPGLWRLAAITRAWVQDAWFNDAAGEFDFSIQIAENGVLALNGLQPNATISLDGKSMAVNSSTVVLVLRLRSIHTVGVPPQIQQGIGRRLIFTGWSDGQSSNPRVLLFAENMSVRPIYVTQYLLTVNSGTVVTGGGGWYQQGEVAQFGIPVTVRNSPSFFGLFTESSQFTGWSGDSTSAEPTAAIVMDGPKTVVAQWKESSMFPDLNALTGIFTLGSLILGINAFTKTRHLKWCNKNKIIRLFSILLISIPIITSPIIPVLGQFPVSANAVVLQVGDASWYYWKQPESDTCILWLGGGLEYSQGGYLLNPLEYESFGTIRFLQDLTKYYCLIALEKGSSPSPKVSNRTIYQELIQGQFSVGRQLHQWIRAQGYKHVFLIGYSVGAEAAASMTISDPQTWTTSDGLILITAWLPPTVISGAPGLNTNLLLLYGHAPTFEPTGRRFYRNAPIEGWHASGFVHKEFRVLDQMGHEVWSPLKDNSYSAVATGITVNFIETSKASQFKHVTFNRNMTRNDSYVISGSEVPRTVLSGDPFFASAFITSSAPSNFDLALAAYDFNTNQILSVNQFNGTASVSSVRLNIPPTANSSQLSFSLFVLKRDGEEWKEASAPYPVEVSATDQIVLQLSGLVPNSDLALDSMVYSVPSTGRLEVETNLGVHSYAVQATVEQNETRYIFVQWDDSNRSTVRSITLTENTTLNAVYRVQYFINVTSPNGAIEGSGWYDANSTIQPLVHPTVSSQPPLAFGSWTNGKESFQLGDPIQVESPMVIQAGWSQTGPSAQIDSLAVTWATVSGILFSLMLILNVKLGRRRPVK